MAEGQNKLIGDVIYNNYDKDSGYPFTTKKITAFPDGEVITDAWVDNKVIFADLERNGSGYSARTFDVGQTKTLVVENVEAIRDLTKTQVLMFKLGVYNTLKTLGYYNPNDGGEAEYILNTSSTATDNGFTFIKANLLDTGRFSLFISDGVINVKKAGAVGEQSFDSTEAFKKVFSSTFRSIFIPAGTYTISDTINIQTKTTVSGVFQRTIIKFTKTNATLFVANPKEPNSNVFNYGLIQNLRVEGLGGNKQQMLDNNQQGFIIQGYQSSFENVDCYYFNYAMRIQGVCLDFKNCTISNNNVGVSLDDYKRDNYTIFNTMIDFVKCNFQYHYIAGMVNIGHGQEYSNGTQNVVQLTLESCVFESNNSYNESSPARPFILKPYSCVLRNTWFELNQGRPQIWKYRLLEENTRYEPGSVDQTIEYVTEYAGAGAYRGSINLDVVRGRVSVKGLEFQYYTPTGTGTDTGSFRLLEQNNGRRYLEIYNRPLATPSVVPQMTIMTSSSGAVEREPLNKIGIVTIRPDGVLHNRALSNLLSVTRISEGRYRLDFQDYTYALPSLTVANPTSLGGTSNTSDQFYGTLALRNENSAIDYNNFSTYNRMFINVYKKDTKTISVLTGTAEAPVVSDITVQDDVLSDGWIHLVFYS